MRISKPFVTSFAAVLLLSLSLITPEFALARGGSGGGGTVSNTCANEFRNISLRSGGNKGGHLPLPESMHVFYDFTYVPCVAWGRVNVEVRDHITGAIQGPTFTWANPEPYTTYTWMTPEGELSTQTWPWIATMWSGGVQHLFSYHTNDAEFKREYDVIITGYDWFTGVKTGSVTKSIITNDKL